MPTHDDLNDLLALTLVPGLGPRLTQALLDRFGSAAGARRATVEQLEQVPHIGQKSARSFYDALRTADPSAEIARAKRYGVSFLPITSPDYPTALKSTVNPPHLLYFRGQLSPKDAESVAIVGSRNCSSYGLKAAARLAAGLTRAGYTVISGLASGIDGAAHRGAIEGGGRTLAVLAGGLSSIYPFEHIGLAEEVVQHGALISETPLEMQPQRGMFHARNRLISGLARATVVIEANDRSGSLITARHAADQGREVFALPANVDSAFSTGSLKLLRDGARLIRDIDDLLEDLRGLRSDASSMSATELFPTPVAPTLTPVLDAIQQRLWDFLTEPRQADEIIRALGLPGGELSKLLFTMEAKKIIRRLPGNAYERR